MKSVRQKLRCIVIVTWKAPYKFGLLEGRGAKMKDETEMPQNYIFTGGEVNEEVEESSESGMEMRNSEREGKMEMIMGESENDGRMMVGGYNRDKPPEDDCCPICFGQFHFPCRTSCGHWFCSNCILQLWRFSTSFKPCKCPICGCLIVNLVPESSVLIQPGEEVDKILKNMEQYNHLSNGGWSSLLMKPVALPLLIRRGLQEYLNPMILRFIYNSLHLIGLLLGILYDAYGFHFFPKGGLGVRLLFDICGYSLVIFLVMDVMWHRWILRRHARHLAEQASLQPME